MPIPRFQEQQQPLLGEAGDGQNWFQLFPASSRAPAAAESISSTGAPLGQCAGERAASACEEPRSVRNSSVSTQVKAEGEGKEKGKEGEGNALDARAEIPLWLSTTVVLVAVS